MLDIDDEMSLKMLSVFEDVLLCLITTSPINEYKMTAKGDFCICYSIFNSILIINV